MDLTCGQLLYAATFYQPAEYCGNDAEPGSEFCSDHDPWEVDWDSVRKDRMFSE